MSQEALKKSLTNFGVTEKEADVYIFLAKGGRLKTGEIAKKLKKNKGTVYRILSNLKKKGLVESTLESPSRYTAVPLEKIIDSYIKSRREEVALVEKTKKDLLRDWERISQTRVDIPLDTFGVIEGNKKIYQKIAEMVKKTQNNLSAISTVSDLVKEERLGVFDDISDHPDKSRIKFRFLTELNKQNLKAIKLLKSIFKGELNVKARNPDLGLALFPRMIIRDDEELLFFLSPKKDLNIKEQEVCIQTNSASLVQAFASVFEELWCNSTNIVDKIIEIETGKPTPKTLVIADEELAKEKYNQTIRNAEKEIILMTSAKDLTQLIETKFPFEDLAKRGISIKIMAPITIENMEYAKLLSEYGEVRHVASTYLGTTIVDGKHLFQLKASLSNQDESGNVFSFKNAFYSTDSAYVKKMKNMLEDIWKKAYRPSKVTIHPIMSSPVKVKKCLDIKRDLEELPRRLLSAARAHEGILSGIGGDIIIQPPSYLKMPTLRIVCCHFEHAHSKMGSDLLRIDLWLKTPQGEEFVPIAIITNSIPEVITRSKAQFAGTPAGQNVMQVQPEELKVWNKGKTLFVGWTIPIPLLGAKYNLDPACIIFDAFGDEISSTLSYALPSGYIMGIECDGFQAFTNYIGPSWKYSGPGIKGWVGNILAIIAKPEPIEPNNMHTV